MKKVSLKRPSPALVVAVLALVAALAGSAVAADPFATTAAKKVTKKKVKKIANKQIEKRLPWGTEDIGDGAVTTEKIDDDAVTSGKIARGAVRTGKIEDGAVTGPKINNGAVGGNKLDVTSARNALGLHISGRRELNPPEGSSTVTPLVQAGGVLVFGRCEDLGADNEASIRATGPANGFVQYIRFNTDLINLDWDRNGLGATPTTLVSTDAQSGAVGAQIDGWAITGGAAIEVTATAQVNAQGDKCVFAGAGRS
jgi:hypothetical protein